MKKDRRQNRDRQRDRRYYDHGQRVRSDHLEAFRAVEAITAISRGFSPERAYRLFDDEDLIFQQIDLHDYTGRSPNALERIKGRVIGEGGKARQLIEELSGAYISVYGHTVCLIGNFREVKLATDAIAMLAKGSMHKTVYNMLAGCKRGKTRWTGCAYGKKITTKLRSLNLDG